MTHIPQIALYGAYAIILTMVSGAIPLLSRWQKDHLHSFVSFGAGVLISTAFLDILPETIENTDAATAGACILASFVGLFILEKFIMLHPCEETHCDYHTLGWSAFLGMLVHTFFDGFALGAALMTDTAYPAQLSGGGMANFVPPDHLTAIVFFAIMAHKIPSSFSLASILRQAQWPRAKIMLFIFIFGAIIPMGALAATQLLKFIGPTSIGVALALSLGTFLYISTSDFLPEVHRVHNRRIRNLVSFLLGIGITGLVSWKLHH